MGFEFENQIAALRKTLSDNAGTLAVVQNEAELLAGSNPENAWLRAEIGGVFDSNGFEHEACVWYERALEFGLDSFPQSEAPHFCVWYGSTLRNVRRFSDSERVLRSALERWPRFSALQFFLGLTLMSQGRAMEAFVALAELHVPRWDESIKEYARAIEGYVVEELQPSNDGLSIGCVRLSVRDVVASAEWYSRVLAVKPEMIDESFALFRFGANMLELARSDEKNPDVHGGTICYWNAPDLKLWIERFENHGAELYRGPLVVKGEGLTFCQLRDPFGSLIGLRSFSSKNGN